MTITYLKSERRRLGQEIKKYLKENQLDVENQFKILVSDDILKLNKEAFHNWILQFGPKFRMQRKNAGDHSELIDLMTEYDCVNRNILFTKNGVTVNIPFI